MTEAVAGKVEWSSGQGDTADELTTRLLDAARDQISRFGVRRSSMDDIAKLAQVGRATVFRRFGTKDELVYAMMLRELRVLMADLAAISAADKDLGAGQRLARAFAVTVLRARTNPLLGSTLGTPDTDMLDLAAFDAAQLMSVATHYVIDQLSRDQKRGAIPPEVNVAGVAEIVVRTLHSIVLVPHVELRLDSEDDLYSFALHSLGPLLRTGDGQQ